MNYFIKTIAVLGSIAFCLGGCATTDPAVLAKSATVDMDWRVRKNAAEKIVDQALLVKIASEDKVFEVRRAALKNLNDQKVLAKISLDDENSFVRRDAVWKLTDQTLLAKVALESKHDNDCRDAVKKLSDQTTLAKIAVEHRGFATRSIATAKLTDQTLLAKIVMNDAHHWVRIAALSKITDQAVIARVATEDNSNDVAFAAVRKLNDKGLLAKVADAPCSPLVRVAAINKLDDSDPILMKIAFRTDSVTKDAGESIARIKLAIREPRIRLRFPDLRCSATAYLADQKYEKKDSPNFTPRTMEGEEFHITLYRGESPRKGKIVQTTWRSVFPTRAMPFTTSQQRESNLGFISAKVSGEGLLKDLLHLSSFTQEDLGELAYSRIPEVRMGAVANLTDQALLAKIAAESKDSDVRKAAGERIKELGRQ